MKHDKFLLAAAFACAAAEVLAAVTVSRGPLVLKTYPVGAPEKNPMFFEKRVYQGSCGKVYPVPFIDKVMDEPVMKEYDAVTLENDYTRVVLLPELGGRIYIGQDKTNNDYDFFYRNDVIKPALVGLAGPWISGGVEFNWPQHHRPATFMPTAVEIEHGEDGSITVWMSDHDPLNRLEGRHGICLRPDSSVVELKARLYNRTPFTQTFLWWANVAAKVHDQYESFFPADVTYVADHAVRATSSFPEANNFYYGVDYTKRPGANNLAWYKNIPVPTSYMVCATEYDFFGGYDHAAHGGFVHVADRHIAPGKKQWTWGNHPFGYAWDRELTDDSGPYVELMAGVYTDNQPDFTYLLPYETKVFSQYWWPYKNLGPVKNANTRLAVSLGGGKAGVVAAENLGEVEVVLGGEVRTADLRIGAPVVFTTDAPSIIVRRDGAELISFFANRAPTGQNRETCPCATSRPSRLHPPISQAPTSFSSQPSISTSTGIRLACRKRISTSCCAAIPKTAALTRFTASGSFRVVFSPRRKRTSSVPSSARCAAIRTHIPAKRFTISDSRAICRASSTAPIRAISKRPGTESSARQATIASRR